MGHRRPGVFLVPGSIWPGLTRSAVARFAARFAVFEVAPESVSLLGWWFEAGVVVCWERVDV